MSKSQTECLARDRFGVDRRIVNFYGSVRGSGDRPGLQNR